MPGKRIILILEGQKRNVIISTDDERLQRRIIETLRNKVGVQIPIDSY